MEEEIFNLKNNYNSRTEQANAYNNEIDELRMKIDSLQNANNELMDEIR